MSELQFDSKPALQLSPRVLNLWCIEIDRWLPVVERLAQYLSPEEAARSRRFLREVDRQRFVISHAAVRTILGAYLGAPPNRVELTVRVGGKPELASSPPFPPLCYNLSHSEEMAMVAVALDREVGVDIERLRPFLDIEEIVERYFAPGEQATWRELPDRERLDAFFRCWTRKEAYLKARGIGLSSGLDQVEVSFAPGETARLLRDQSLGQLSDGWQMYDVSPPGKGYMAACVVEKGIDRLTVHQWPVVPGAGGDVFFRASPKGRS